MDDIYEYAQKVMADHVKKGRFTFIRKKSMDALADIPDESLDFVYIDGNHEGDYPIKDIEEWAKKVKPGGLVAGHDYVRVKVLNFTVKDALEKYTVDNDISPWFVLGTFIVRSREIRDNSRSWMFIKK
jgi:predicted O-methyltransferase YrrM